MAIISDTFTISFSGEPGDGSHSLINRFLYEFKEKLLGYSFKVVYENSVPNTSTHGKTYLLSFLDGVFGVLLTSSTSNINVNVGIIAGISINPSVNYTSFNIIGTGVVTFNCFFSNNFYCLQNLSIENPSIMFFKTNYGWCPCNNNSFFVNINGQYYWAYTTSIGNNLGYLNLDNNHVLYSPSFTRQTVPGTGANNADRRLDDTIKYAGTAYVNQNTLNQLKLQTMYKINDTNETFYYGYPLSLIYFD